MRVLIIGAGIGGLAAARALLADGHEVAVFEQAEGLRRTGAAVTLWSNGTGTLDDLGVSLDGAGAPIGLPIRLVLERLIDLAVRALGGHPRVDVP